MRRRGIYLAFGGGGLITENPSVSSWIFTPASGQEAPHSTRRVRPQAPDSKNASGNPPEGKTCTRSSVQRAQSFRDFSENLSSCREHLCFTHHSARVPLDGLFDLAVGAPSQRLQELVAVLQVVLVVVLLHARVPPPIAACRGVFGRAAAKHGWSWLGSGGVTSRGGMALLGPRRSCPPVGR